MKDKESFWDILICVKCHGKLKRKNQGILECLNCQQKYHYHHRLLSMVENVDKGSIVSMEKWENFYVEYLDMKHFLNKEKEMMKAQIIINKQYSLGYKISKDTVFLEIGCGPFLQGQLMADKCKLVIGVDFSINALKIAEALFKRKGIKNYLLIQADIVNLPIKDNCVDLIFGIGVLEHFEEVEKCINSLARVTRINGRCVNCVPIVNIGSLTYRQLWGNIPDIPVLDQILKLLHFKLLKTKLVFGYERSYRTGKLKNWHLKAGFNKVLVERLNLKPEMHFIPKTIRNLLIRLAEKNWLFWPMAVVKAIK